VGHNEAPVPHVRGADARSRKKERPARVTRTLQVSTHIVECHVDESSNVLSNNPSGPELPHHSEHFRPEETVILRAFSLPGTGERLAWETTGEYGRSVFDTCCPESVCCDILDIPPFRHIGPMSAEDPVWIVRLFHLPDRLESCPLGGHVKPADTAEEGKMSETHATAPRRPHAPVA